MPLVLKRKPGQAFKIEGEGLPVWVYINQRQDHGRQQISLVIEAPGRNIQREEILIRDGKEPGPHYDPEAY